MMSLRQRPCRYMERMLNQHADGRLRGFAKWYTLAHLARCRQCTSFLEFLEDAIIMMREAKASEPSQKVLDRLSKGEWRSEVD